MKPETLTDKQQRPTAVVSSGLVSLRSRQSDPEAYDYGFDAGLRGATVVNSHFSLFQNGSTKHWQQGYDDAKRAQANAPR
jgi:hypothetical protein